MRDAMHLLLNLLSLGCPRINEASAKMMLAVVVDPS